MNTAFFVSPYSEAGIVENMAYDAVLLHDYPRPINARIRCYGWTEHGATFGYSQRWGDVRQLTSLEGGPLVRRLTGGGVVPHGEDFTYALVLPPAHPFYREKAVDLYRLIHDAVATCLHAFGQPAELEPCPCDFGQKRERLGLAGACFVRAEPYDVVEPKSRRKLAGAAMKRDRDGLLVQGSLELPDGVALSLFERSLIELIAARLDLPFPKPTPGQVDAAALQRWTAHFADAAWNQRR
ncbi:MAG: lipoate-protein ligase A [Puniceicoccaceae bacterium 5H]|nr:MAG: lipoate-protein ligase A [Puniceicoccaceae bacterium 5H]